MGLFQLGNETKNTASTLEIAGAHDARQRSGREHLSVRVD
jgi:hypothetical protein